MTRFFQTTVALARQVGINPQSRVGRWYFCSMLAVYVAVLGFQFWKSPADRAYDARAQWFLAVSSSV